MPPSIAESQELVLSSSGELKQSKSNELNWSSLCAIALCGAMALQGSPTCWVAVHRMHHQYTDRPGDPHSPRDGKRWAHMGWILRGALHNETDRSQGAASAKR
jgi:fatty-acid desaturase